MGCPQSQSQSHFHEAASGSEISVVVVGLQLAHSSRAHQVCVRPQTSMTMTHSASLFQAKAFRWELEEIFSRPEVDNWIYKTYCFVTQKKYIYSLR